MVETAEGTFAVARGGIREGMSGDTVRVTLSHDRHGEALARVQSVIERATTTFLGTYGVAGPLGAVVALDERIRRDFFVLPQDESASRLGVREGDVVEARILSYPARGEAGVVTVERRVGSAAELDLDVEAVIASFDLPKRFPDAALAQARDIREGVAEELAANPHREDLRDLLCVTVDPATARDFDDAVSCRRTSAGGYVVGVHIADVTHYVPWGSPIDVEARARTCSVYLVDRVIPMLPERLCDDVCSLVPGGDRLAMSVFVTLGSSGEVVGSRACCSAIRSKARLDYDTVDEVLAGEAPASTLACVGGVESDDVASMLSLLDEVSRKRQAIRRARGSIDFESSEAKVELDEAGHPIGVSVRRKTPATSLVEEAMLLANEAVAGMLAAAGAPVAYRVHEAPSPDSLGQTIPALRELDLVRPEEVEPLVAGSAQTIQAVLARAEGASGEYLANALLLRAMKRAIYLPHNDGHYALGAKAYCHFTSPIRRYPDDTVHRALKVLLAGGASAWTKPGRKGRHAAPSPLAREQREAAKLLPQLCRTCSERERIADAAGRASQRVKIAELYEGRIGESFSGVVVGCERFGLFVRLDDTCAEGLLPIRALGNEWFSYDEAKLSLAGEESGRCWRLGQRVAVTVAGCNPARGQIDFTLADGSRKERT